MKQLFEESTSLSFQISIREYNHEKYPYKADGHGYEPHNRYINIKKLLEILPNDIIINNCIDNSIILKSNIEKLINDLPNNKFNNIIDNLLPKKNDTCNLKKNINKNYNYTFYNLDVTDVTDAKDKIAHIKINKYKDNKNKILIVFNKDFSDNIIKSRIDAYEYNHIEDPNRHIYNFSDF